MNVGLDFHGCLRKGNAELLLWGCGGMVLCWIETSMMDALRRVGGSCRFPMVFGR